MRKRKGCCSKQRDPRLQLSLWERDLVEKMHHLLCSPTIQSTEKPTPKISVPFHHPPSGSTKSANIWRVRSWCTLQSKLYRVQSRQPVRDGWGESEGKRRTRAVWWYEIWGRYFLLTYVFAEKYRVLKIRLTEDMLEVC